MKIAERLDKYVDWFKNNRKAKKYNFKKYAQENGFPKNCTWRRNVMLQCKYLIKK